MDVGHLSSLVSRPEIHRQVLRRYAGPYSLGVTRLNGNDETAALRLRVEDANADEFPNQIEVQGETVPVLVDANWNAPTPQNDTATVKIGT